MQYQFTERIEQVKSITFHNSPSLINIERIRYFQEEGVTGSFIKKEFRYSFNNSTWTNWNTLTQQNLTAIQFRDRPDFWLEVRYSRKGIGSGNIQSWYLFYDSTTPTPPVPPVDASIDADTLMGEGPEYYLDRENQTGPFTDLNIENITGDSSTIGVYDSRLDTSLGTSFYFKRIGVKGDLSISEGPAGTIYIDGSLADVSIGDIYERLDEIDSSVSFLSEWNIAQDSSIVDLRNDIGISDTSILELTNTTIILDSSIGHLSLWNQIQDTSIISLESKVVSLDSSIIRIDASIDTLFSTDLVLESSINYNKLVNITQDASIIRIDTILQIYDVSIWDLYIWQTIQDASIKNLGTSISTLDSSIQRIDSSLSDIYNLLSATDASIIEIGDNIQIIDGSIVYLTSYNIIQDASIEDLKDRLSNVDGSISVLENYQNIQDASIIAIENKADLSDASIQGLTIWNIAQDASINGLDSSIGSLTDWNTIQDVSIDGLKNRADSADASIIDIKSDISVIEASIALITDDEVINIGESSIGVYSMRDASNNILLKSIDQIGPVVITQDSSTILIDSSIVKIYDTDLSSNLQTFVEVGGISEGTLAGVLKGDTYTDILDQMLFPIINPTLIDPSIVSFTKDGAYLWEVDAQAYLTFTTIFSQGIIKIKDTFQDYRSGLPRIYHYRGPNFNLDDPSTNLENITSQNIDLDTIGINTWVCWVSYSEGPQPLNSYNNDYLIPLPDGSTDLASVSIEAVYPLFATSDTIGNTDTKQNLVSMLEGTDIEIDLAPETGGNKQSFDIPTAWTGLPTNRPLLGIQTLNTVPQSWEYQGGDASTAFDYWTTSFVSQLVQGVGINYIRYTYNGDDRSRSLIRLKF